MSWFHPVNKTRNTNRADQFSEMLIDKKTFLGRDKRAKSASRVSSGKHLSLTLCLCFVVVTNDVTKLPEPLWLMSILVRLKGETGWSCYHLELPVVYIQYGSRHNTSAN